MIKNKDFLRGQKILKIKMKSSCKQLKIKEKKKLKELKNIDKSKTLMTIGEISQKNYEANKLLNTTKYN